MIDDDFEAEAEETDSNADALPEEDHDYDLDEYEVIDFDGNISTVKGPKKEADAEEKAIREGLQNDKARWDNLEGRFFSRFKVVLDRAVGVRSFQ